MKKVWAEARRKVDREARCRIAGCTVTGGSNLQAAHTIGQKHQDELWERANGGIDYRVEQVWIGGEEYKNVYRKGAEPFKKVPAAAVVPMCLEHHQAYDAGKLDLLAQARFITKDEAANAVRAVGIARAYKIMTGEEGA